MYISPRFLTTFIWFGVENEFCSLMEPEYMLELWIEVALIAWMSLHIDVSSNMLHIGAASLMSFHL